jgi:sentrin-specific protease 1
VRGGPHPAAMPLHDLVPYEPTPAQTQQLHSLDQEIDFPGMGMVFVPFHAEGHWALVVVFMVTKKICFYNSLRRPSAHPVLEAVRAWVVETLKRTRAATSTGEWELIDVTETPQQTNGYDCGVFTIECMNRLSLGARLVHTQAEMTSIRWRVAMDLVRGTV